MAIQDKDSKVEIRRDTINSWRINLQRALTPKIDFHEDFAVMKKHADSIREDIIREMIEEMQEIEEEF